MKATKTTGNDITGVDVHFTIGDLVNLNQLVHAIMTDKDQSKMDEQTPAEALALVVYKITSGGLDLEQSSKDMHSEDYNIFDIKKEETEFDWTVCEKDLFNEVDEEKDKQKTMVGILIDLESRVPLLQIVKDEADDIPDKIPDIKVVGKIDLDKI